jgi:hypothetical protein
MHISLRNKAVGLTWRNRGGDLGVVAIAAIQLLLSR